MRHFRHSWFYTLVLMICLAIALPLPVAAQQDKVFGSWRSGCNEIDGKPADCYLYQSIFLKKKRMQVLRIAVGEFLQTDRLTIAFTLPLGIAIAMGGSMQVDHNQPIHFDVQFCSEKQGCNGTLVLGERVLNELDLGDIVHVVFYDHNQKPVTLSVSLDGFFEGLRTLFVK